MAGVHMRADLHRKSEEDASGTGRPAPTTAITIGRSVCTYLVSRESRILQTCETDTNYIYATPPQPPLTHKSDVQDSLTDGA